MINIYYRAWFFARDWLKSPYIYLYLYIASDVWRELF